MGRPIFSRDEVAHHLAITVETLARFERRGLVAAVREGDREGYGPAEIRRLWTIVTFRRDLGINLAGVEVILRLRDQMATAHARLGELARELNATLDDWPGPDGDA
ncbi:MerR family transcriptional regulator [Tundrisphaera sp. TA3]|uniref:MerR family transcriptional regulator n=1 Tax=Tundrisphaera sp. TA3 TaxID=3435775 RepID=UPI003EBEBA32